MHLVMEDGNDVTSSQKELILFKKQKTSLQLNLQGEMWIKGISAIPAHECFEASEGGISCEIQQPQIYISSPDDDDINHREDDIIPLARIPQQKQLLSILAKPRSPRNKEDKIINPTSEWLHEQQRQNSTPTTSIVKPTNILNTKSSDERKVVIPPIRAFRQSSMKRYSQEIMTGRRSAYRNSYDGSAAKADEDDDPENDRDRTLKALEGITATKPYYSNNTNGYKAHDESQRQAADSEDLFLTLARDDFTPGINRQNSTSRPEKRRSRIALPSNRLSMPPVSYRQQADAQNEDSQTPRKTQISQPVQRERSTTTATHPVSGVNRSRYIGGIPRSSPITPRASTFNTSRELSPESVSPTTARRRQPSITDSAAGAIMENVRRTSVVETSPRRASITEPPPRKLSITETALSIPRSQYRQSNQFYTSPRAYNSSPLAPRAMDTTNDAEIPRENTEETESTVSTTAQSTIWDELDDIKQRMRRLEFMGKMPPTSGAAISNSSNERPRTATTTATTNSTSPKRGRGNSIVSTLDTMSLANSHGEAHPNLRAALAKSKSLLHADVYQALEKTANDALTIAAMMGSVGQPGPISSAQSGVGASTSSITDRQVRKKTENMCRSLTELCIALNDRKSEEFSHSRVGSPITRPITREEAVSDLGPIDTTSTIRKVSDVGGQALTRLRASPRTLERLSDRRNSLYASTSQPVSPQATTPTQATMSGRRTSLLLRSRRGATEEPEETETRDARFRAPSRALTEIGAVGRTRNSPREYTSSRPLPELREASIQPPPSLLPMRRQFISDTLASSLPTSPAIPNAVSRLDSRRYLERANRHGEIGNNLDIQPEEERTQRKSSLGLAFSRLGRARTSSITRRTREVNDAES